MSHDELVKELVKDMISMGIQSGDNRDLVLFMASQLQSTLSLSYAMGRMMLCKSANIDYTKASTTAAFILLKIMENTDGDAKPSSRVD